MIQLNIGLLSNMSRGVEAYMSLRSHGFKVRGLISANEAAGGAVFEDLETYVKLPGDCEIREWIHKWSIDVMVVAGFPRRISKEVYSLPKLGSLNMHAGPLPEFRGGSALAWQIIEGRTELEISMHMLEEMLDSGPIVMKRAFYLAPSENIGHAKLLSDRLFASMVVEFCSRPREFIAQAVSQESSTAGHKPQRTYADGEILWESMSSRQVSNLVRATSPTYGGAHCWTNGQLVRIYQVAEAEENCPGPPGTFFSRGNRGPFVVCNPGVLEIIDFSPEAGLSRKPARDSL